MMPHSSASSETHERILRAALDTFMHHGYNATTMDDIAAASDTSKGTLYWHFESKENLLESAIRGFFEGTFMAEVAAALDEEETAAGKLRALTGAIIDAEDLTKGLFNLFLEYWASSPNREKASALWFELLISYQELVEHIIEGGIERGEFRAVDGEALTWALLAMYDGLAAYGMLNPDLDLARIHAAAMDGLLRGLESDT